MEYLEHLIAGVAQMIIVGALTILVVLISGHEKAFASSSESRSPLQDLCFVGFYCLWIVYSMLVSMGILLGKSSLYNVPTAIMVTLIVVTGITLSIGVLLKHVSRGKK